MTAFIIEVANTHGGDKAYLLSLIKEFNKFEGHGIKFQPLHPDEIATSDFTWYPVYQKLHFTPDIWEEIITKAVETKRVWLDLFDPYGVRILRENKSKIFGIKLQASVLYNEHVISALEKEDCSDIKLIVNISAIEKEAIKERINYLQRTIAPAELLLEVGFQSYPTELQDSGISKLSYLKANFSNAIVFADHIDGRLDDAITLPLMASVLGADYIEKHVMHSSIETQYDHFSSIKVDQYEKLVTKISEYEVLEKLPFINEKERLYLKNSIQKPIAHKYIKKGKGINMRNDLEYKRSNKIGLSVLDLQNLLENKCILSRDIKSGDTFHKEDFKKAMIATIIAGRLKSSRLKSKAILPIGEISSVEKCIQSCLRFLDTTYTILATSTLEEDAELEKYTFAPQVVFHKGHPEDVIQRYLDIIDKLNVDVVLRVTADMPYVSAEITEILLREHFLSGADYTAAIHCAVGTAPEVINVQALKEVKKHFPNADYSEYMTWYFQNNREYFHVNMVELPSHLTRDYRLTLDYQEDLDLFNHIQKYVDDNGLNGTIGEIFSYLDNNPELSKINQHIGLKYRTDQKLIETLNQATKIKQ